MNGARERLGGCRGCEDWAGAAPEELAAPPDSHPHAYHQRPELAASHAHPCCPAGGGRGPCC